MTPGECQCGCGARTPVATRSDSRYGRVKGQHARFISGHNNHLARRRTGPDHPDCRCGCGLPTSQVHLGGDRYRYRDYILGHGPSPDARFVEAAAELVMAVHDGGPDDFREHLTDALALDAPDGVTPVEALVAALAALVDPDTRTATVRPVHAYLTALQDTAGAA